MSITIQLLCTIYIVGIIVSCAYKIYQISKEEYPPDLFDSLSFIWFWPLHLLKPVFDWIRSLPSRIVGLHAERIAIFEMNTADTPRCPICAEDFVIHNEAKKCKACRVMIHPDCLEWNAGQCGIYGCKGRVN